MRRTMVAKKHYTVGDIFEIARLATLTGLAGSRSVARCDRRFSERIMLAVTEVNGCELCSYAHSRFALDAGMDETEVRELLGGVTEGVPGRELVGVAFGQHYADTGGRPDPAAWEEVVGQYGEASLCVLRAARTMMWGNALGIPVSALRARIKGRPYPRSTVGYELGTSLGGTLVTPLGVLVGVLDALRGRPVAPERGRYDRHSPV